MKTLVNVMAYGMVAGASMYGGYLIGTNMKKKRNTPKKNTSK